MNDPKVLTDHQRIADIARRRRALESTAEGYARYQQLQASVAEADQMLAEEQDLELRDLANAQKEEAMAAMPSLLDLYTFLSVH